MQYLKSQVLWGAVTLSSVLILTACQPKMTQLQKPKQSKLRLQLLQLIFP